MSTVLSVSFPNAEVADEALRDAQHCVGGDQPFEGHIHGDHLREEGVPLPGTHALRGAILGGLIVGISSAVIGGLIIWPANGYWFGIEAVFAMFVGGLIFGVVAGAVAGASEAKATIRDQAKRLGVGEVILTCEIDDAADVSRVEDLFRASGGHHIQAA